MSKDIKNKVVGTKIKAIPTKPKEIGIDTDSEIFSTLFDNLEVDKVDMSSLEEFSQVAQTREQVYGLIDTMSQDDRISSILETYAEDIVETNDQGQVVWCESSDENVASYVTHLLDSLSVDKNIYGWAFKLVKYGDLYLRLYRESDYQNDILFGNKKETNEKTTLNEDVYINLTKENDHYVHHVEAVPNPGEVFELTRLGKTMGYIVAPVSVQKTYDTSTSLNSFLNYKMKKNDVDVYEATEFVHACLEDNSSRTPEEVSIFLDDQGLESGKESTKYTVKRGQSLLSNAFIIWRELSLLENSVLMNRLTKSAIVRILNVDIGSMPKEKVRDYMGRLKSQILQKSALDVGKSLQEYTNPGPIENIIFAPTHGTQGTISAQTLGGDVDPKQLTDLDWFNNRLYGSFRVPKQYFGWTDDSAGFNGGSSLSILSSRYGKAIKRIQNTLCQMITDLINLYLIDRGLLSYINKFTIRMQSPITQEELDRRENMRNRIGVINDIMGQVNNVVEDDIRKTKIIKELLANAIADPEVIALLQEQIDDLEKAKEEENTKEDTSNGEEQEELPNEEEEETPRPSHIGGEPSSEEESEFNSPNEGEPNEESSSEVMTPIENEEEINLPNGNDLGIDLTNMGEI